MLHVAKVMVLVLALCSSGRCLIAQEAPAWGVAHVGVLAWRGTDDFEARWAPLRAALDARIAGWRFQFSPVTLSSVRAGLETGEYDFIITNPGHFVTLEREFPMSVLATRARNMPGGEILGTFGSAIFVPAGSGIRSISQLAGRRLMAVDAEAFGGFQVAWRELVANGVDPFADLAALDFVGFPQDQVVQRVLAGEADAGVVRTGLIESLVAEGRVPAGALRVLGADADFTYPHQISTRAYPEWPFVALSGTDPVLRTEVAATLLTLGGARDAGPGVDRWLAPVSYHAVRELVASYEARAQTRAKAPAGAAWLWWLAALGAALTLALLGFRRVRSIGAVGQVAAPARVPPADASEPGGTADGEACTPEPALTRREEEILGLVGRGQSTKEIARALGISPKTVEFHRSNLLRKFGVRSSVQLVKRAS